MNSEMEKVVKLIELGKTQYKCPTANEIVKKIPNALQCINPNSDDCHECKITAQRCEKCGAFLIETNDDEFGHNKWCMNANCSCDK